MIRRPTCLLVASLLVVLPGCAADDGSSGPATPSGSASSSGSASPSASSGSASSSAEETDEAVEITVSVRDGKVSPKPRRVEVEKDSQVRLLVTSDVDDEIHVHGFEIEAALEAGRTATVEFVADQDGVFEVETHDLGLALVQLQVR